MTANVARGTRQMSSSNSVQEKGSRNERNFRPPQIECSSYEFTGEKSQNNPCVEQDGVCDLCSFSQDQLNVFKSDIGSSVTTGGTSDLGCERSREELEADEFQDSDWGNLLETQLKELILSNLDTMFKSAIKKITYFGYSEEVATKTMLRSGLCYGYKDTVSNIVDNTLAFLSNVREIDSSRDHFFEDLAQWKKYIVAEMVCVLREVRPFFSTGDAMWCLLICDMNLSHACAMDGDPLSSFGNNETTESSSVTVPQVKSEASSSVTSTPPLNSPKPNKPNPLLPFPQSSQSDILNVGGITNLPPLKLSTSSRSNICDIMSNMVNPVVIKGQPPEKVTPVSSANLADELSAVARECVQTMSQSSAPEGKPSGSKKGHTNSYKRESILRQKPIIVQKNYRAYGAKGSLRVSKTSNLGGLILEKKCKSVSDSNATNLKNASLKLSRAVGVGTPQADGSTNLSINAGPPADLASSTKKVNNSASPLPVANTELPSSLPSKNRGASKPNCNVETPNCSFSGISYDKIVGQLVPQDKKDEVMLKLDSGVRELQTQMQEWSEWAQQKIMQVTRRLGKDKAELKTLRQEKEEVARLRKEKQSLEENTMKKLLEMENALGEASGQFERANVAVRKLEVENSELRSKMEGAKLRAAQSAASCKEVSSREKKTLKKIESWEKQKALIQEELVTERCKPSQLQKQLEQAKEFQDQLEARWRQEGKVKDEALTQANSGRKEREQIEVSAKSKEDMMRLKSENDFQIYRNDIQRLEREIAQLKLKSDSSKMAALRRGIDGSYASSLTEGRTTPVLKQANTHYMSEMAYFPELGNVLRERECVMCLTEEMSVLFLPCAHQVVCTTCNDLHEKQGMKDCPSCRTPINRRIHKLICGQTVFTSSGE
ncbi:putative E3 ubiquitin-protein ligase RF298 [Tasmannia lanceolata]|uniref:putative E3 ubiquitin-protein ligase RF298 n=1 Tax=Tasmannia lanceolata TaxID=3420 RepID=UPI0040630679